jgi:Arc/MetJ-type ribon-helix-helix transcriptional regulator
LALGLGLGTGAEQQTVDWSLQGTPVTINLRPEQQRVIDLAVQSGAYQSPAEVLDQALEIIREQLDLEDWMVEQREAVAAHLEVGFAQAERGELMDGDAALEMLRQRRAERLKCRCVSGPSPSFPTT